MPSQPRTTRDGLEGLWKSAEAGWRETNRRWEEAESAAARRRRDMVEAASGELQQISSGLVDAKDRASKVVDAVVGDRTSYRPESGPVDYVEVDRRVRATQDEIARGFAGARVSGYPAAASGAWPAAAGSWLNRVRPRGEWDDKQQHPRSETDRYERQGNFSYGATAAALGLPKALALRGAGVAQRWGAVTDAIAGRPIRERAGGLTAPYGDDPRDQLPISEGYEYGRRLLKPRR